jgi:hypothetical protein
MAYWTLITVGMDFTPVAATGRRGATGEAAVADYLPFAAGALTEPEGSSALCACVGEGCKASEDEARDV